MGTASAGSIEVLSPIGNGHILKPSDRIQPRGKRLEPRNSKTICNKSHRTEATRCLTSETAAARPNSWLAGGRAVGRPAGDAQAIDAACARSYDGV